jgi:preprotein translocase subunit SecY
MKEKHYIKSKTIWGAIVAALPALIPLIGADKAKEIEIIGSSLISLLGCALAIYGRVKAEGKIVK